MVGSEIRPYLGPNILPMSAVMSCEIRLSKAEIDQMGLNIKQSTKNYNSYKNEAEVELENDRGWVTKAKINGIGNSVPSRN